MKQILFYFLVLTFPIFGFSGNGDVPGADQAPQTLVDALKKGDASTLAKYFDSTVHITLLDDSGNYSNAQAEQMLKTFFSKNKVESLKIVHNVDAPNGVSSSFVGQLKANGKSYRVYVLYSGSGNKVNVQKLSITSK